MKTEGEKKTAVIAIGGNAIKKADETGTVEEQFRNIRIACKRIIEIVQQGYNIVLTHGNGPQAGALLIQQDEGVHQGIPSQPLDICGAMTQGQIGFMLQQTLTNFLNSAHMNIPVVSCVTQVLIDPKDPDFQDPSKPIGPFYTKEEAAKLKTEKSYDIKKVKPQGDRPYRRVVPSPEPQAIIEEQALKILVSTGVLVIASGGGGIPVMRKNGILEGVEAVIDKDLAGEKLAEAVGANLFIILTDIDQVKLNYGTSDETPINKMSVTEANTYLNEGHFLPGSMAPKIQAAIRFINYGGQKVVITSLEQVITALEGNAGTTIHRN